MSIKPKRQCYIKDNLCYIPLKDGREAITDKEYYNKVSQYFWYIDKNRRTREDRHVVTMIKRIHIKLTDLLFSNDKQIMFTSYKNNNILDCRKENVNIIYRRQCYIKDDACYIPLQDGQEAICDKEFYDIVNKYQWHLVRDYAVTTLKRKHAFMHKFLFPEFNNKVTHINGNMLDNRKSNLEELFKRVCYIENNICHIPLNNNQEAICDADRFDEVSKYNWYLHNGYVLTHTAPKSTRLHRFLYPELKLLDHINRNKLDNRSCNLREATQAENVLNRSANKNSKLGYKGICYRKRSNKYEPKICYKNKIYYLGTYITPEEAAEAYNKKAIELFGEYACLNIIPEKKTVL
jgi:hypothetical protein